MSDGALNEISQAIGGLQSDVANVGHMVDRIFQLIKENSEASIKALAEHTRDNEEQFQKINDHLDELQGFKNTLYGAAAFISFAISVAIQFIGRKF